MRPDARFFVPIPLLLLLGESLSFYSIKVADGPLTSRLQHVKAGDYIIMKTKPTGTLVMDALLPGKRCYLVSTGTGVAPFCLFVA